MSLFETRLGANIPGLPGFTSAPLPSLTAALSRRAAIFGPVALASFAPVACSPARGQGALSANDVRLVALAYELYDAWHQTQIIGDAHPVDYHERPEWDLHMARFDPAEDEIAVISADTLAGVLAKARALQIPPVREVVNTAIGISMADDLVRLFGGAAHA